jgi:hypothetical protein
MSEKWKGLQFKYLITLDFQCPFLCDLLPDGQQIVVCGKLSIINLHVYFRVLTAVAFSC